MPYPIQVHKVDTEQAGGQRTPLSVKAIEAFPRFNLGDAGRTGKVRLYARGEQVVGEGRVLEGIYLILDGAATLTARTPAGGEATVAHLACGEFFGERSLTSGQLSDVTVTAAADLEVLVIDADALHGFLARTPQLGREIGQVVESRRLALDAARSAAVRVPRMTRPADRDARRFPALIPLEQQ